MAALSLALASGERGSALTATTSALRAPTCRSSSAGDLERRLPPRGLVGALGGVEMQRLEAIRALHRIAQLLSQLLRLGTLRTRGASNRSSCAHGCERRFKFGDSALGGLSLRCPLRGSRRGILRRGQLGLQLCDTPQRRLELLPTATRFLGLRHLPEALQSGFLLRALLLRLMEQSLELGMPARRLLARSLSENVLMLELLQCGLEFLADLGRSFLRGAAGLLQASDLTMEDLELRALLRARSGDLLGLLLRGFPAVGGLPRSRL